MKGGEHATAPTAVQRWVVIGMALDSGSWEIERDLVEVVHCRDCISRVWDSEAKEYWCDNPLGLCAMLKDGDFCSYGERKDDG